MIRQLIEAEIPEIYIVVGHQKEAFSYLAEKYGVYLIENTEYAVRIIFHLFMPHEKC